MADIQKMLEINSRLEKGGSNTSSNQSQFLHSSDLDSLIESIDQQVYGEPSNEPITMKDGREKYDPEKEMRYLKEIQEKGGHRQMNIEGRNMPKEILDSFINNPIEVPVIDPEMDEFERKLTEKMSGVKKAVNIVNKINKQESEKRQTLNEQLTPKVTQPFNYDTIKNIVESAIDSKISELKQSLNETVLRTNTPSAKLMSFKDKFLFVDSDDNVFECVMQYKGKKKRKKQ